jgi:hypothetical protein
MVNRDWDSRIVATTLLTRMMVRLARSASSSSAASAGLLRAVDVSANWVEFGRRLRWYVPEQFRGDVREQVLDLLARHG